MRILFFILFLANSLQAQTKTEVWPMFQFDSAYNNITDSVFERMEDNGKFIYIQTINTLTLKKQAEFFRIDSDSFYYRQYDSIGNVKEEGKVTWLKELFFDFSRPLIDKNGKPVSSVKVYHKILSKNGIWTAYENNENFSTGKMVNGVKYGVWQVVENRRLEKELIYKAGVIISENHINKLHADRNTKVKLLSKHWNVSYPYSQRDSITNFTTDKTPYSSTRYIYLKEDGTAEMPVMKPTDAIKRTPVKWSLTDNDSVLNIIFENRTIKAKINYLSAAETYPCVERIILLLLYNKHSGHRPLYSF